MALKVTSHVGRDLCKARNFSDTNMQCLGIRLEWSSIQEPTTKPTVVVKVDVKAKTLQIRDNGRGMLISDLQRYFQMHGENNRS